MCSVAWAIFALNAAHQVSKLPMPVALDFTRCAPLARKVFYSERAADRIRLGRALIVANTSTPKAFESEWLNKSSGTQAAGIRVRLTDESPRGAAPTETLRPAGRGPRRA